MTQPLSFEAFFKIAHDSGDGETIYHCPFCGSGQVIARSDRTIECEFCHTCFTVQVQPQFSAFPQTINGVPVDVPGMPGQIGQDPMLGGDPSMPPGADPMAAGAPPFGAGAGGEEAPGGEEEDEEEEDDDDSGGNPFTSSLRAGGRPVSQQDYLARLALAHSDDRDKTLAAVRASRR